MKLHLPKSLFVAVLAACAAQPVGATITTDSVNKTYTVTGGTTAVDEDNAILPPSEVDYKLIFKITATDTDDRNYFANGANNQDWTANGSVQIGDLGATADDSQGMIITNGNSSQDSVFAGKVTGTGILKRTGNGSTTLTFSGDVTEYKGNIHLGGNAAYTFTLTFGGQTGAVAATSNNSSTAGVSGTGNITIASASNKLVYNYSKNTGNTPVYITNAIAEAGSIDSSVVTLKGGADYVFTKTVSVDKVKLEAGSLTLGAYGNNVTSTIEVSAGAKLNIKGANAAENQDFTLGGNVTGTGTLQVESGATLINNSKAISTALVLNGGNATLKGDRTMSGNITINSGSVLTANGNDVLQYNVITGLDANSRTITVNAGGELAMGSNRWSFGRGNESDGNNDAIYQILMAGGKITRGTTANANGNLDFFDNGKITATGTTSDTTNVISADIKVRGNKTLSLITDKSTDALSIDGKIIDAGKISKSGDGDVYLSGNNTYTGGTTITKGTLKAEHANALGTGKVLINGGTLRGETGLTLSEVELTSGAIELTSGETTIKNGLSTSSIDLTGSSKLILGVKQNNDASKKFSIGTTKGGANLQLNEGSVELGGKTHELGHLDVSNSNSSTAQVTLKSGATVTTNGNMWVHTGANVSLENTASLAIGNVKVVGNSATSATIARNDATAEQGYDSGDRYTVKNIQYTLKNADVEIKTSEETTVSNRLENVALINTGSGKLIAGNGYNYYTGIAARGGDIHINNFGGGKDIDVDQLSLSLLEIAANKTVTVKADWYGSVKADVSVSGTASFGAGARLDADLTLKAGTKVTMGDALTLGNGTQQASEEVLLSGDSTVTGYTLSLEKGLTLQGNILKQFDASAPGSGEVILFRGVDTLNLGGVDYNALTDVVKLSDYFRNDRDINFEDYYIGFKANGDVYAGLIVPEPATATLSLLALAGLCARRRRK